jgi:uridylate kinase
MNKPSLRYQRVLLKLSGEALCSDGVAGVCASALKRVSADIQALRALGVDVAIVVGGGNWTRGRSLVKEGLGRHTADHLGMLGTIMNGLALRDVLSQAGLPVTLMSTVPLAGIVKMYDRLIALDALKAGHVVIFTAGVGTPLFTTDTAASLRAVDMGADILLKASTTDAVYSADPNTETSATPYKDLTYQFVIEHKLQVMDMAALCLCQAHRMPIRVFRAKKPGALKDIVLGADEGTLIHNG